MSKCRRIALRPDSPVHLENPLVARFIYHHMDVRLFSHTYPFSHTCDRSWLSPRERLESQVVQSTVRQSVALICPSAPHFTPSKVYAHLAPCTLDTSLRLDNSPSALATFPPRTPDNSAI